MEKRALWIGTESSVYMVWFYIENCREIEFLDKSMKGVDKSRRSVDKTNYFK